MENVTSVSDQTFSALSAPRKSTCVRQSSHTMCNCDCESTSACTLPGKSASRD